MQACVYAILTIDGPSLNTIVVPNVNKFSVWIRVFVGTYGEPGFESFDTEVASPDVEGQDEVIESIPASV
jgi:hypothetical protein